MKEARVGLLLFLAMASVGWAQTEAAPPAPTSGILPGSQITGRNDVVNYAEFARPRRMIYYFQAGPQGFSAADREVLYRSVLIAVAPANPNVILFESPEPDVPSSAKGMEELARQIDADCWLSVTATGSMREVRVEVSTFDILRQQYFGQRVIQPGFPLDYRTLAQGFWDDVAKGIRADYGAVVDTVRVKIQGIPGTRIAGLGSKDLAIGGDGSLEVTLPNPATYTIRATAAGFYPVEHTFYLGYDPLSETLQQNRAARFSADFSMSNLQFPEARFWYFPVPATVYLRAGLTTYALGVYLINSTPSILRGNPLTRLNLGGGFFLSQPGRSVRFYTGLDGFVRIAHGSSYTGVDESSPFGGDVVAGIEYSPIVHLRFFAEYAPLIYYTPDSATFREVSFPNGEAVGGYIFSNGVSIDLRNVSFGVRFAW